jgi:hypothetical protein
MGRRSIDLVIILTITFAYTTTNVLASDEDLIYRKDLTSSLDDPQMDSYDLAFYLAIHGFNAVPKDGYVEMMLKGSIYILTPNGEKPELFDIKLKTESYIPLEGKQ